MHTPNNFSAYHLACFLLLIILFTPHPQSFAGSGREPEIKPFMVIDADKQFEFAQRLFSNQKYSLAIGEFQRFIYFFPQDNRVELALYRIGESYYNGKRFPEAVHSFQTLVDRFGATDLGIKSYLMISAGHMQLHDPGQAIINLHNLITISADVNIKDEAYYRLGWIYLEAANWKKARYYFDKISAQNRPRYKLKKLAADLAQERLIPQKNPTLAGFLSVIPGGGFLYCERYQDALIAFLLNSALMFAAYESFDDDNTALGGVLTFVGFGFYAGNIYGAVAGAHKYNWSKTNGFIEKLKTKHKIDLSADLRNKGACLTLKFAF